MSRRIRILARAHAGDDDGVTGCLVGMDAATLAQFKEWAVLVKSLRSTGLEGADFHPPAGLDWHWTGGDLEAILGAERAGAVLDGEQEFVVVSDEEWEQLALSDPDWRIGQARVRVDPFGDARLEAHYRDADGFVDTTDLGSDRLERLLAEAAPSPVSV